MGNRVHFIFILYKVITMMIININIRIDILLIKIIMMIVRDILLENVGYK